jgi:hypothetical protein
MPHGHVKCLNHTESAAEAIPRLISHATRAQFGSTASAQDSLTGSVVLDALLAIARASVRSLEFESWAGS